MSHLYQPSLDQHDAFGRLRTSSPLTLFDSSHRYRDNNLFTSLIVGTGSTVGFVTTQGTNRYITILPSGSDTIDGRDRAILAYDFGSLTFVYRNGWRVV